jgi:hypothetical protein
MRVGNFLKFKVKSTIARFLKGGTMFSLSRLRIIFVCLSVIYALTIVAVYGGVGGTDPISCAGMAGQSVDASSIGLPTGGTVVTTATLVLASDAGNTNGEYCKITGNVLPSASDPAGTPKIQFQLNLPTTWNEKAVHIGGGGYGGTVITGTGAYNYTASAAPLAARYATFGSDSGHVGNSNDAAFGLNEGALLNYGYQHIKKTHDAAFALITKYYGKSPTKSYFVGGSTAGREGLTTAQRFSADYDGILAQFPAINFTGVRLIGVRIGQLIYGTVGGYMNITKQALIYNKVLANCDADDGLTDGIIHNIPACKAKYAAIRAALRCPSGADEGNTCLSDTQLTAVDLVNSGMIVNYTLANGVKAFAGYNILSGTDFSGSTYNLGTSPTISGAPSAASNGDAFSKADGYLKYFVKKDASYNSLLFDIANPGADLPRLIYLSDIIDATKTDLSAFRNKGGKIIILHGLADATISPNDTISYYKALVAKDTQGVVDSYIRFYTVPGMQHGSGVFYPSWDGIGALDAWVTSGTAPGTLIGTDTNTGTLGRTRPICIYPKFPKYKGSGSVNDAANFVCTDPT